MTKKSKNSKLLVHYTRTMTPENLSRAANYVGGYVLRGLGALGKIFTAPLTGGPMGTNTVPLYPRTVLLANAERKLREAQEELIGKAMTWVSPLNYGAALATGNGLNARKGEEEVASWSPAWQAVGRLGELYVGPKAVKGVKSTPRVVVNTAAKAGVKPAKAAVVVREINKGIKQNTKNGRIEVIEDYFNSPDKWYRITETPEKYGIMELGKNVTTHDAALTVGTINGWRSSMLKAPITKSSEGFIKRPHKIELGIRRKNGQAHGNTSQAAKGKLWGGTTSGSNLFPEGVIEGQAPSMINYGIDRTNFVITPWELVPNGGRVGFHTGEMPMSNLGWFQKTNKGTYTYEPIIPEKRININPPTKLYRVVSEKTYPWYRGKQHSVKEVVNSDGTVNPRLAMRIQHEVSLQFPGSYKMEHRLENPEWHKTDPTTFHHTKLVAQSAWRISTPLGFTKYDQMVAVLGHDFGKIVSGDGHAQIGADLAKLIFPDMTEALYKAIAEHMGVPVTSLGKATKMADMRNGIVVRDINGKTRILLPTHTDAKPREIVIDPQGDNKYYVHMRVWDDVGKHVPGNISDIEKGNLFQTLYEFLPDNAEILFPKSGPGNYGTRGTVAGLQRLSRDPRFTPGTKGTLQYLDKDGKTIKTYEGTSFIKTPKLQSLKQGGKMNILEFLKNGSGIHIKEKNKGKFTSYCGGKVTDECILKGKNSSNPAIRKRATFAANARKWKHLDGGIIIAEKGIKAGLKAKQNLTKRKAPDWDNLDRGYRYLTQDMKLPHDLAIAIMGNVVEESQGNYKAALKNGGGRGLIQWDGQPTPTGRYGLWGKIWASVAKPANVYDSKTDTMKNYWAPWGGLKGELVRLKFINAPLKTKTKIYAESYLRPGNPRIKDRQLSAMLLDSIYNPRIKNIIIDKEGGIIKAEDGTKFSWQSALTNMGTNLFNSYLQSKVQNNKINSEAEAAKAENEIDLNQYFLDIYLQELAKALLEEDLKNKAINAMNDTVINSSPLVTLKIAYDKASKSYGNLKANLDARNKAIDAQAEAAKSSAITDAVSGVIQNGLGMLKDYYGSKNNNTSITNTSNNYFDNSKYKKFGTFNPDGSMNMLGGTFTINGGYKPNQPQLFNYQPLKLNV